MASAPGAGAPTDYGTTHPHDITFRSVEVIRMKKLATLFSIIIGGMVWQQMRYLSARRNRVQDRQPMLYPAERFHVITFLDTTEGQDVAWRPNTEQTQAQRGSQRIEN